MSAPGSFKAYKVTNRLNGRAYIGITRQKLQGRWANHVSVARRGRRGVLADAIREHGEEAFLIEHLASAMTWDDLCATEITLISQERTLVWEGGYNVTEGGEGTLGRIKSEDEIQAIRDRLLGVPKSPEHRAKLALAKTGVKASPKAKANMSLSKKGKPHTPEWVRRQALTTTGRPKSPEHRAKLSAAKMGQTPSAETCAKLSALLKGRKLNLSPEQRAKRAANAAGRPRLAEERAKISAARRAAEAARRTQAGNQERLDL